VAEDKILLIIDNFRVGGIQRLALDQLCLLADLGIPTLAYYRQARATDNNSNFLILEKERINAKSLLVQDLPEGDWAQLKIIIQLLRSNNFSIIINHSVGASVILRIAKIVTRKKVVIKTFIHQLPTLSAPIQRLKRFIYALTSDEIYGYSRAVVEDWNKRSHRNLLSGLILGRKQLVVLRNGIYLERLPKIPARAKFNKKEIRMVFIGRGVSWKNIEFIISTLRRHKNKNISALLVLPYITPENQRLLELEFKEKIKFEIGKKIEDIIFTPNDINIYPVDYGPDAEFIESVSLNCLEMACIGIPSIVTKNGVDTWPELVDLEIIHEVDWKKISDFDNALEVVGNLSFNLEQLDKIRGLASVTNNLIAIRTT